MAIMAARNILQSDTNNFLVRRKQSKKLPNPSIGRSCAVAGTGQPLPPLQDTTKLKKHIAVVCERLARGARLAG